MVTPLLPVWLGTIYTEYINNDTSFNIIVIDYKDNEYIQWQTENGDFQVRYIFSAIDPNITRLTYVETGNVAHPFTKDVLVKLKEVIECM